MATFCKEWDEDMWDELDVDCLILCEGHGRYEILDKEGRPYAVPLSDYLTLRRGYCKAASVPEQVYDYLILEKIRREEED